MHQYEFRTIVRALEERFTSIYDATTVSEAKTEAQMTPTKKSLGWFVTLDYGLSFRVSAERPDFKVGDTFVLLAYAESKS